MSPLKAFLTVLMVLMISSVLVNRIKANTAKVGVGNFVMAVSYTDSYKDLQYVANFVNCDQAQHYYNENCLGAIIMLCQLEEYLHLPDSHDTQSTFDFEPTSERSCGFVGVQQPKFTEEY